LKALEKLLVENQGGPLGKCVLINDIVKESEVLSQLDGNVKNLLNSRRIISVRFDALSSAMLDHF